MFDIPGGAFQHRAADNPRPPARKEGQGSAFRRFVTTSFSSGLPATPAFRTAGKFSFDRYKLLLAQAGNPRGRLRGQHPPADAQRKSSSTDRVGRHRCKSAAEGFVTLVEQQREVAVANIDAEPFVKDGRSTMPRSRRSTRPTPARSTRRKK
jgi:hypothetical protein